MKNKKVFDVLKSKQKKITTIEKEIGNIVSVIASSGSTSLLVKLTELETQKAIAKHELEKLKVTTQINLPNESEVIELFWKAKQMLSEGSLSTKQKIISRFVNKVIVNKDSIEVMLDLGLGIKIEMPQDALENFPVANNAEPLNCGFDGGEGLTPNLHTNQIEMLNSISKTTLRSDITNLINPIKTIENYLPHLDLRLLIDNKI
jgi:hypothetical protein